MPAASPCAARAAAQNASVEARRLLDQQPAEPAGDAAEVREQRPVVVSLTERRLADPDATIVALPPDRRPLPTVDAYDELLTRRPKAPASMSPASGTTAGGAS